MPIPVLLVLLLSSSTVFAAPPPAGATRAADDWKVLSLMMDKDRNGKLTRQEALSFNPQPAQLVARDFAAIDANNDSVVTKKEYTDFIDKGRSNWVAEFNKADTDKSGGLSRDELKATKPGEFAQIKRAFAKFDSDSNGQVSIAERDNYFKLAAGQRAARMATARDSRSRLKAPPPAAPD